MGGEDSMHRNITSRSGHPIQPSKDLGGKTAVTASRTIRILLLASATVLTMAAACSTGSPSSNGAPSSGTPLPAETTSLNGESLLEARCSSCHSADRPRQKQKTREEWQTTVTRMIGKGAELTDAEQAQLVDYLAATYGP
jgi:mono/diheme cytochrome c family protein